MTAAEYGENLTERIEDLVQRLRTKRYRTKVVRRCYIPKEGGKVRPLGIPALEDKLVQLCCSKILSAIYEQDFLPFSYGLAVCLLKYRDGRYLGVAAWW